MYLLLLYKSFVRYVSRKREMIIQRESLINKKEKDILNMQSKVSNHLTFNLTYNI